MAVWTQSHAGAARLIELDDEAFVAEFAEAFGDRLGRLTACGPRLAVPLKPGMASRIAGRRVALAGNAAQTMHSIAARWNWGLRDAAALAALLARPGDPGEAARLDAYVEMRRIDALAVTGFTHSFAYLFDQHDPVRRAVRGAVMTVLDTLPMASALCRIHGVRRRQPLARHVFAEAGPKGPLVVMQTHYDIVIVGRAGWCQPGAGAGAGRPLPGGLAGATAGPAGRAGPAG